MSRPRPRASARWTRRALLAAAALVPALPLPARAQTLKFVGYSETATFFRLVVEWTGVPGNNLLVVGAPAGGATDYWAPTVTLTDFDHDGDYGGFNFCATHKEGPHPDEDVDPSNAGCVNSNDAFSAALEKTPPFSIPAGEPPFVTIEGVGHKKPHPTIARPHFDTLWVDYRRPVEGGKVQFAFWGEHLRRIDDPVTAPEPASLALLGTGAALLAGLARRRRRA